MLDHQLFDGKPAAMEASTSPHPLHMPPPPPLLSTSKFGKYSIRWTHNPEATYLGRVGPWFILCITGISSVITTIPHPLSWNWYEWHTFEKAVKPKFIYRCVSISKVVTLVSNLTRCEQGYDSRNDWYVIGMSTQTTRPGLKAIYLLSQYMPWTNAYFTHNAQKRRISNSKLLSKQSHIENSKNI